MQAWWMVLGAFFFACMAVCVKFASTHFNVAEIVFARGLVGVFFLGALAYYNRTPLRTRFLKMHIWRSFIGITALSAWFYSISQLPLATAMTLNYMSSVWIAAFLVGATLIRRQPQNSTVVGTSIATALQIPLVLTVMAGFVGVVLLLQPTLINKNQLFAGGIGLASGICAALAYMQVTALSRVGEPETRTVFYFSVGGTLVGALGVVLLGVSNWYSRHAFWLLPTGLFAALGQLCMTHAYAAARTSGATLTVACLQYFGIVFASIFSVAIFDDAIPALGWAGIGLIICSGVTATVLRNRGSVKAS